MRDATKSLEFRYGELIDTDANPKHWQQLEGMINRGSCRQFQDKEVPQGLLNLICAAAMASPTKSDLQQRDIIILKDDKLKAEVSALVDGQAWVSNAPNLAIFCGNNRRQRLLHEMRGHEFVNDHLDAFFNAAVDAGIALSAFVIAAEACGLACCPISAVRNQAKGVSDLLGLPDHVFPVAGLAFGYPQQKEAEISMRLPLSATVHTNRYDETDIISTIETYDQRRKAGQPYAKQRSTDLYGTTDDYTWSEDKARQYSLQERETFGEFVREKGFRLV